MPILSHGDVAPEGWRGGERHPGPRGDGKCRTSICRRAWPRVPRPRSRLGLRMAVASDRDPVIAGGAGFTEGVVRERHGDDGVGGMAGAEDVVDAAKPMLAVEGYCQVEADGCF